MKAKIKPRIDLENRTKLETVIPLQTPFIINIDPSDKCNFKCKFCPTGDRSLMENTPGRNHGSMDFALYKKIIDDICEFDDKVKVIRLYKDGEPLLNPHFADMVRYAKTSGCCDRVDTTTNASLLTPKRSREIIEAGLNRINISIEGINSEQYKNFSGYELDYDELVENIRFFYEHRNQCEMIIKTNGDILTEEQKQQFYDIFGDIADGVYIESIMSCWAGFDLKDVKVNENVGIYRQQIKGVEVCPYVFYSFSINSDGTASTCFLDWSRKMIIGDAKTEKVKNIWHGKKLYEYQKEFLNMNRSKFESCRECGQLTHGMPDNIDDFAPMLWEKIRK